jgi:hypothetical protein
MDACVLAFFDQEYVQHHKEGRGMLTVDDSRQDTFPASEGKKKPGYWNPKPGDGEISSSMAALQKKFFGKDQVVAAIRLYGTEETDIPVKQAVKDGSKLLQQARKKRESVERDELRRQNSTQQPAGLSGSMAMGVSAQATPHEIRKAQHSALISPEAKEHRAKRASEIPNLIREPTREEGDGNWPDQYQS